MKYVVIFEPTGTGFSAYIPDLPGCVAAGSTVDETERRISEAASEHVRLLRERGEVVPEPTSNTSWVEAD